MKTKVLVAKVSDLMFTALASELKQCEVDVERVPWTASKDNLAERVKKGGYNILLLSRQLTPEDAIHAAQLAESARAKESKGRQAAIIFFVFGLDRYVRMALCELSNCFLVDCNGPWRSKLPVVVNQILTAARNGRDRALSGNH